MAEITASYTVLRNKAIAGQIADTSLYNVDGACAALGDVAVGKFVFNSGATDATNPEGLYKIVKPAAASAAEVPVGVVSISHANAPEMIYRDGSAVNVLTHGRIWVPVPASATLAQVAFDKVVVVKSDGSVSLVAATATDFTTGHRFTGELVANINDSQTKLAKIQLIQSSGVSYGVAAG
jgi:hypothetical protein